MSLMFDLYKVAEIELTYHSVPDIRQRPTITSSAISHEIFRSHWDANKMDLQEQFKILLLNRMNAPIGIVEVGTGSTTACIVDTRLVFAAALKANATSIVLAHNHPSGNLKPSDADIKLTERFIAAGKILDVAVLDHLIITTHSYTSLLDRGIFP
jgi:DNA repair protein RadC